MSKSDKLSEVSSSTGMWCVKLIPVPEKRVNSLESGLERFMR